jgi:hypothetical protein
VRSQAIVKSIPFKTSHINNEYGSLESMATNPKGRKNKIPFVGTPFNVGSTTYHNNATHERDDEASFGRPAFFMRFNFTSAIVEVPYVKVFWCDFVVVKSIRSCWIGHVTRDTWTEEVDNIDTIKCNPFVSCDALMPSRFVLSYEFNLDVCFNSLDQDKLGAQTFSDSTTDLGDDILQFKGGKPAYENDALVHPNFLSFLQMKL